MHTKCAQVVIDAHLYLQEYSVKPFSGQTKGRRPTTHVSDDIEEMQMSVNGSAESVRSASREGRPGGSESSGLKKIVAASMAGTVVEWYEFFLYATAASLVFGKLFFPNAGSQLDGIIAAFVTYAVGFIARPLGGIVFGQIGDRLGRKQTLQATIILVGVATFLMGCLPGFNSIGYWAPALLVILRFIQGFAVGGEWGGAVLLVAEHSPNKSRAFWSSWPQAAVPVGNLLATLVLLIMSWSLPADQFLSWGWRVAFWLSAVIVVIGYYIRTRVNESPIFLEARALVEAEKAISYGVGEVIRKYPKGILQAMGLRFAENILYYTIVSFSIVYLVTVHQYDTSQLLLALLIAHVVHFLVIPQVGRLSDAIGRKPVYYAGAVLGAFWAFFAFPMFDTLNPVVIVAAIAIGLCFHALMYAGQPAIMSEMFPTRMRYSGVSLGYQVTSIIAGSLAPIIATALLQQYKSWVPVAIYLLIACAITFVTVITLTETKGTSLRDVDAVDARKHGLASVRVNG
jgi:MFS family permease